MWKKVKITAPYSSYMTKYLRISSYIRKPFFIYDFATASIWMSLYMRNILFLFISAWPHSSDGERKFFLSVCIGHVQPFCTAPKIHWSYIFTLVRDNWWPVDWGRESWSPARWAWGWTCWSPWPAGPGRAGGCSWTGPPVPSSPHYTFITIVG